MRTRILLRLRRKGLGLRFINPRIKGRIELIKGTVVVISSPIHLRTVLFKPLSDH